MNDKLIQDLLESLKNNLPEMQVRAVEERLKEYDVLKKKLDEFEHLCKNSQKQLDEYEQMFNKIQSENNRIAEILDSYEKREAELKRRELSCEEKERNWEKEKLQIKLDVSKELNDSMFNLVSQVFHSPVYQSYQHGMMTVRNNYGGFENLPFEQLSRIETASPADHQHVMNGNNSTHTIGSTGPML